MNAIDFNKYSVMTFDCYGTLIDWESGMLAVLKPLLARHNVTLDDEQILGKFAQFESDLEKSEYRPYREILKAIVRRFGEEFGFTPSVASQNSLPDSIQHWQPFSDTIAALQQLKQSFKLAIVSNIDDALFADTAQRLTVPFDYVITAEQVQSYKPSLNNFHRAIKRIGLPSEQILHAACSVYHDIVPANSLGLTTIWVNRHAERGGSGAAPSASAEADLVVPDLQTLAALSAN